MVASQATSDVISVVDNNHEDVLTILYQYQ
jgi:hypothetical protein